METNHQTTTERLFEEVESYTKTTLEILELKLIDKSADIFSTLTAGIAILVVVTVFCFILSIGVSFYIGQFFVQEFYGFFIVALFYFIVLLLMYFNKSNWIKKPVKNLIISILLKQQKDKLS